MIEITNKGPQIVELIVHEGPLGIGESKPLMPNEHFTIDVNDGTWVEIYDPEENILKW